MRKWLFISAIVLLLPIWGQNKEQESFGIDVSHHDGKINWEQVPDVEFVYIIWPFSVSIIPSEQKIFCQNLSKSHI